MNLLRNLLSLVFGPAAKKSSAPPPPSSRTPQPIRTTHSHTQRLVRPRAVVSTRQAEGLTVLQVQEALRLATLLVAHRPSLPILSHCVLSNGALTVTDLETTLTVALPGLVMEPICVPVALLQKALRFVTDPVRLVKRDMAVILNDTFTLPGLDPADFPVALAQSAQAAIGDPFVIPDRWADLLPAVSLDHSRLNLSGVCIDVDAGYCVSSDGHRLHALRIPSVAGGSRGIVPLPAAKLIARLLPKGSVDGQFFTQRPVLTAAQKELLALPISPETPEAVRHKREALEHELQQPRLLQLRAPGVELWARLIEEEFPDYLSLLQRPTACTPVILPRVPFMEALQACVACAPKRQLGASLTRVPAGVRVRLEAAEYGAVERVIPCQGWQLGRSIGLNARYLLQPVTCLRGNEVRLQITGAMAPVHLEDPELHVVLMPMRILEPVDHPATIDQASTHSTPATQPAS